MNIQLFQPGTILYDVIRGSFTCSGVTFEEWCRLKAVNPAAARSALKGYSTGPKGRALIDAMVKAAGAEVVTVAYRLRIERHAAEVAA